MLIEKKRVVSVMAEVLKNSESELTRIFSHEYKFPFIRRTRNNQVNLLVIRIFTNRIDYRGFEKLEVRNA